MISKLPRWVELGAFSLALVAGCVNAVGFLGFEHQSISHLSGTVTLLGVNLVEPIHSSSLHLAAIVLSFFLGAAVSGYLLHGTTLQLGRNYEIVLFLESALLVAAFFLLTNRSAFGHYAASVACGLQNALVTTHSGAIIRTTHVTGIFTDLGIMFGARLRGEEFDRRKAILFLLIVSGFFLGGISGAYLYSELEFHALLVPALVCALIAVVYRSYRMASVKRG